MTSRQKIAANLFIVCFVTLGLAALGTTVGAVLGFWAIQLLEATAPRGFGVIASRWESLPSLLWTSVGIAAVTVIRCSFGDCRALGGFRADPSSFDCAHGPRPALRGVHLRSGACSRVARLPSRLFLTAAAGPVCKRRTKFGVRMALGATNRQVLALAVQRSAQFVLAGIAVGALAACALSDLLADLLYQVSTQDGYVFADACSILGPIGPLASCLAARRAAATALRQD